MVCVFVVYSCTFSSIHEGVRGRAADAQAYTSVPFFLLFIFQCTCILSRSQKLAVHEGIYRKKVLSFPKVVCW